MSRLPAFVGELALLTPRTPHDTMTAHVELPRGEFDAVSRALIDPALRPAVAILACDRPAHPLRDNDVLALAAARLLNRLLGDGEVRLTPDLLRELGALAGEIGLRPQRPQEPARTAETLTRIAAALAVPVETFSAPPRELTEVERCASLQLARMRMDPLGEELACLFAALPTSSRVALLRVAWVIFSQLPGTPAVEPTP